MRPAVSLSLLVLCVAAASAATPLHIRENGPQGRIFVPCRFDAASTECLLDTGANSTMVPEKSYWDGYKAMPGRFKGGSGHVTDCKAIVIDEASLGDMTSVKKMDILRCPPEGMGDPGAGQDFLRGRITFLDFKERTISEVPALPEGATAQTLLDNGKILTVKVTLGGETNEAMFDTGAALSVVDKDFVKAHPELFTPEGIPSSGKDAANREIKVQLYKVKELTLGGRTFKDSYAIGLDFSPFREIVPVGSVFVVGYNLISAQNWYLDVDRGLWATE